MIVIDWIDALCDLMGTVEDGRGGKVKSYRVNAPLKRNNEFPESISEFPCVLSYTTKVKYLNYNSSSSIVICSGVSEFHICSNNLKSNYPVVMPYYDRIVRACASDIQLGGLVSYFTINQDDGLVSGKDMQYGSEAPHLGIIVNWEVKENPTILVS